MTKEIKLTQGQVTIVDDWNYEWLSQWKWRAQWNKDTKSFYAVRSTGTHWVRGCVLMHREISKTPKDMLCDHRNHNTLLNTEENLRNVTRSQNQMNKRMQSNNKVGEKNIRRIGNRFQVRVKVDRKYVFDKMFDTMEDAIVARNYAIIKYHGEYGNLKNHD